MADIVHQFLVHASPPDVFRAIQQLDVWWTKRSSGDFADGAEIELWFGPDYDWRARISRWVPDAEIELELTRAQEDWQGTRVGLRLAEEKGGTGVHFHHLGWPEANDHYRISCYCWAMYLRLLKRYVEHGEVVAYEDRLEV